MWEDLSDNDYFNMTQGDTLLYPLTSDDAGPPVEATEGPAIGGACCSSTSLPEGGHHPEME